MIKFFRNIRKSLLSENKFNKYLVYAIGEIVLVVIGILIALSINNWNENRKDRNQERFILERLQNDLLSDLDLISYQIEKNNAFIKQYLFCIDVLLEERQATRSEFMDNFRSITTVVFFKQNRTTFDNIVSSGQMELIRNKNLTDAIISYYNQGEDIGWDSGLINSTRNIYGPYLLGFDHKPAWPNTSYRENASQSFTQIDFSKSRIKPKSIDQYRDDLVIMNMLRSKIYLMEGQIMEYKKLKNSMETLSEQIKKELKN